MMSALILLLRFKEHGRSKSCKKFNAKCETATCEKVYTFVKTGKKEKPGHKIIFSEFR